MRLLQENSMSKYTTAIRDIIIVLSEENNDQKAVERSKMIKQQNEGNFIINKLTIINIVWILFLFFRSTHNHGRYWK